MKNASHIFSTTNYNFSKFILRPSSFEIVAHSAFFSQTGEPLLWNTKHGFESRTFLFFASISAKSFQIPPPLMGSVDPKQWVPLLPDTAGELNFITSFAGPTKKNPAWSLLCKVFGREGPLSRERVHFGRPIQMHSCACPSGLLHIFGGLRFCYLFSEGVVAPLKKLMMSWTTF